MYISNSCVKQQFDVGLFISLLATQLRLFEINKVCLAFELRLRNLYIFHSKLASFFNCFDARNSYVQWKVQGPVKMVLQLYIVL